MYSYTMAMGTVRTSTPKKSSPYDFDPGPSTSTAVPDVQVTEGDAASTKTVPRKGTIMAMICEAIESVGSPTKGASYIAIQKWIINSKRSSQPKNLRTSIRKAISRGLETGILKRSFGYKNAIGARGFFTVNKKYKDNEILSQIGNRSFQSNNINQSASDAISNIERKRSILRIAENLRANAESSRTRPKNKSEPTREASVNSAISTNRSNPDDRKLEAFMNSMLKIKDFQNMVHTIAQQASEIQEAASKLIEVSNSLSLRNVSRQSSSSGSPQDEARLSAQMNLSHRSEMRPIPAQARPMRATMTNFPSGMSREDIMHLIPILEGNVAQLRSSLVREEEGSSIHSSQGSSQDAREVNMYLPSTRLARVAPMSSAQGVATRSSPMDSTQSEEARSSQMNSSQHGEARSSPMNSSQSRVAQSSPINYLPSTVARSSPLNSSQSEGGRSSPMDWSQNGWARSTPMDLGQNEAPSTPMDSSQSGEERSRSMHSPQIVDLRSPPLDLVQNGYARSSPMHSSQEEVVLSSPMHSSQNGDAQSSPMNSSQSGMARSTSMISSQNVDSLEGGGRKPYPQVRLMRLGLKQSSHGEDKSLPHSLETTIAPTKPMNSPPSQDAMHLCENRVVQVELGDSLQHGEVQESPMQSSQYRAVKSVNNGDSQSDQSSKMDSQSQESLNEEIRNSSQRSMAFSDSSFDIGTEVSVLLKRIEDDDLN